MNTMMDTKREASNESPKGRGRVRLAPLAGSLDRTTHVVEIDLHHRAGALTVGDLRRTAEKLSDAGDAELAFRMWTFVRTAAIRSGHASLVDLAEQQAEDAQREVRAAVETTDASEATVTLEADSDRRSATNDVERSVLRYDYEALAADHWSGLSKSEVARKWGCSPSTVQRAVDFVTVRDDLVDESPEVMDQIMAGVDLGEIARRYDVSSRVLKWMVNTNFERRSNG